MKRSVCILLTLMLCLAAAGCAKEEVCGTPLAPAMMELRSITDYFALKDAVAGTDDELKAFLEENGYTDCDITDRAQAERSSVCSARLRRR